MHGADGTGGCIGSLIAHYAHRHYRQQDSERLPDLRVQTSSSDFVDYDIVSLLKNCNALRRNFTQDSDRQSRPGKRLALNDLFRHAKLTANAPDFILKQ